MQSAFKISIGAFMIWIILLAFQLVLFEGVWRILVIPPVTIVTLAINLGLFFVLVRPPALNTRIIGMLLGAIAAAVATVWPLGRTNETFVHRLDVSMAAWLSSTPDPDGLAVKLLTFLFNNRIMIAFFLLDLIGVTMIVACGWLENRLRRHWMQSRVPRPTGVPPLDDPAASPL